MSKPRVDRVVSVRLSAADWEKVKEIAECRGEKPAALMRGWITDQLFADAHRRFRIPPHSVTSTAPLTHFEVLEVWAR